MKEINGNNKFKAKFKQEIASFKYSELQEKLNAVNRELQKGKMEISRQQNPYAHDCVSGYHNMKNLRYMKAVITNKLNLDTIKGVI